MELRPGNKQTEVGEVPLDWQVFRLSDHFEIYAGGDVPKDSLSDVQSERFPYPIFANALQRRGLYGYTNERRSKPDSITITARGYLGHAEYREEQFFPIVRLLVLEPRGSLDAKFSTYVINNRIVFPVESTGVPQLTAPQVSKYSLAAPTDVNEQRAIAAALSDVDALIAGLEKLIAKKRDLKQAAMQQLLTDQTRLPGFSGELVVKRLGDVGECLRGVSYKGDSDLFSHDTDRSKRLLRSNNVQESLVVTSDLQYVKVDRVREHQILREGDILICMANGSKVLVGKAGYFEINDGFEYTFGAFMGVYRGNEQANRRFVFYLFQTGRYRDYITNLLAGSSINNLSPSSIESLQFKFPELSEQEAIAQTLTDMDSELITLESRLAKTRELKQGMMQELLTGRTRLV